VGGAHRPGLVGVAGDPSSAVHALDPRAKVVGLFAVTLIAVSASLEGWPVFVACAVMLAAVAAVARVSPATLWRRGLVILPLILLVAVFVPFLREGGRTWEIGFLTVSEAGLTTFGEVSAKAAIGTLAAVLLAATTSFPAVLRGLERLRMPRVLVLIASLMYRYLFVLADELLRMIASARSRCYRPRTALRAGALGRITGAFLLRAHARGERVHRAMVARGYTGTMPHDEPLRLARADVAFVACVAGPLLALRAWTAVAL
jgi:cobalt/nickel transport system permease protein